MRMDQVPQQDSGLLGGETKGIYAINDQGKLEMAQTSGWEVESFVLQQAIDEIDRITQDALNRVKNGDSSTLEFHMYAQRMDLPMLAQAVGRFQWQVKRHFRPEVFSSLKEKDLELYAEVLDISVVALKQIPNSIVSEEGISSDLASSNSKSNDDFSK